MSRYVPLIIAALVGSGAALADTAYVKPSTFDSQMGQTVTIDVSFSDLCCEPSYPVKTDTYVIINPDGTRVSPDRIEAFAVKTVLEHKPTQTGTTRISTGERLGRKGEYVILDGEYHLVNSPDAELKSIPESTPVLTSQTATVTDAYISVDEPNWRAVTASLGRLQINPITHPNTLKKGETFTGRIIFDGKPLKNQKTLLTTEAQRLSDEAGESFWTDENGVFSVPLNASGISLLMVRLQAESPEGAATDIRSYTTALTLNVD